MDCKASIKIKFEIYGQKFDTDMYINYWPDEGMGIDQRIIDWFTTKYEIALKKHEIKILEDKPV